MISSPHKGYIATSTLVSKLTTTTTRATTRATQDKLEKVNTRDRICDLYTNIEEMMLPITKMMKNQSQYRPITERRETQYFCSPGVHLCTDKLRHRLCRPTPRWFPGVTLKSLAPQGTPRKAPQDTTLK